MVAEKSTLNPRFGAHGEEEIPVLIPNTEVKLLSGDYTATSGKLARCRIIKGLSEQGRLFLLPGCGAKVSLPIERRELL